MMSDAAYSFTAVIGELKQTSELCCAGTIPENWMQGRTTYGGLSAALCLAAVNKSITDLPPLRSALINFVGPAGGDYHIDIKVLRQGKSVSTISADLVNSSGLATHAVFTFGASRPSRLDRDFTVQPKLPSQADSEDFFKQGPGPTFSSNFDCRLARGGMPLSGSDQHEHFIWARHRDAAANDLVALVGLADMPPPAVLPMFTEFAPISSMNWMMNFLSEDISTDDGWWLMRSAAEHARDGYSSQDMQVWNTRGELVITGRQNVAVFY